MINKRFRKIMTVINCLMAVPVVYVLIREIVSLQPFNLTRVIGTALVMAIPLGSTLAITITGCAALDDNE